MQKQKLFEYTVLYHPKPTKEQRENDESPKSMVIVPVTTALAFEDKEVGMKAARDIPVEYTDKLDSIEIIIRPF